MDASILSLIQNVGFPIFVAVYLMIRTEKIINRNTLAIEKLSDLVKELCLTK